MKKIKRKEPNQITIIEKQFGKEVADLVVAGLARKAERELYNRKVIR